MQSFTPDTSNEIFQLAIQLVNQTHRSIFLTGKAGTGKTTFLKYIRESCPKQMAIVAPTGVAAINAGGVTIHSFFQLPFSPFIPETGESPNGGEMFDRQKLLGRLRFTNEKRKIIRQLDLLIIDEISMVRCDTLDAIDTVLRSIRKRPLEKFGGLQVLFIGDMFQLPPVARDTEWNILSQYYQSPYFFDSRVISGEPPLYIEFDKIYRQSEETFIRVLNQVRNNEIDEEGFAILENRYRPVFRHSREEGYIILTTHNEQATRTNNTQLEQLPGRPFSYEAEIENDFPENAYPADELLTLKQGAQVMFIRNDLAERGKRYFNGRIGMVSRLEEEKIFVQCPGDPYEIEVGREKWENIRYTLNKNAQTLEEELLGSFNQFPVRLAWAITIHKSQGLTFEKAIIDAGEAFAPGQVYVALSRCSNLDGLVLKSKLRNSHLHTDARIIEFSRRIASSPQLQKELERATKEYQEKILGSAFDFGETAAKATDWKKFIEANETSFSPGSIAWAEQVHEMINSLQETGLKFNHWLREQFLVPGPAAENNLLRERTKKAAGHFSARIEQGINLVRRSPAVTDSRENAKEFNDTLKEIFGDLAMRQYSFQKMDDFLSPASWHQQKKNFVLPSFTINAYAGTAKQATTSPHPALFMQLKELRDAICSKKDLPVYMVAGSATLDELSRFLPQTPEELMLISGFGEAKLKSYGAAFLEIIVKYCRDKGLDSLIHERTAKKEKNSRKSSPKKKGNTQAESFRLYKEGMSPAAIAQSRQLTLGTIENHLLAFISSGEISVEELVKPFTLARIRSSLESFPGSSVSGLKQRLGKEVSYGEIRMALAWLETARENSAD